MRRLGSRFRLGHLHYFNPRTREGCDFETLGMTVTWKDRFQSTHPRRVRHYLVIKIVMMENYFNPRTREGCDYYLRHRFHSLSRFQSTHPRRVRRGSLQEQDSSTGISIHAPAKGATSIRIYPNLRYSYFNPRTREGCDQIWKAEHLVHVPISIHAPAKGATDFALKDIKTIVISIHAPAKGATQEQVLKNPWHRYFNPRTREGCDITPTILIIFFHNISIHAPAKGATDKGD